MGDLEYREGDWFAVPLRNGGYAVGVIARTSKSGVLLGFFFGPKRVEVPSLGKVAELRPQDAVLIRHFGHLALKNGEWPNLGAVPDWDRRLWTATEFGRQESLGRRRCFVELYDEDDPNKHVKTVPSSTEGISSLPQDGLSGSGAIEVSLSRFLS